MAKYFIYSFLKGSYNITQQYGENVDYYKQVSNGGLLHGHEGVDIGTPNGTEIFSPFDGIIVRDQRADVDYGNFVVIWDPIQKCGVWFCHLQDVCVNVSDKVTAGQLLGHTNNTGNTSGPHVHVNFVETDENGYRLHTDDGEQGFMNLLDPNLVEIKPMNGLALTDAQTPLPTEALLQPAPAQPVSEGTTITLNGVTVENRTYTAEEYAAAMGDRQTFWQQRDQALSQLKDLSQKYDTDTKNYSAFVAAGYPTIDLLQKKLMEVNNDNLGLQKQLSQVLSRNAVLASELSKKDQEDATAIDMGIKAESKANDLESTLAAIASAHNAKPSLESILSAVDKLKTMYENVVKQLQKKTVKQSIQAAVPEVAPVVDSVLPQKALEQNAWDWLGGLFLSPKGGGK